MKSSICSKPAAVKEDDLISIDSTCGGQNYYSKNSEHISLYALKPADQIEVEGSKGKLRSGYSKPVQKLQN